MQALDFLSADQGVYLAAALVLAGVGLPVPIAPLLLAVGALAGTGRTALAVAVLAPPICLTVGDIVWFILGRKFGKRILQTVCRISLERDVCIRKTQEVFVRRGLRVLLYSRFVPGLGTLAPSMAGAAGNRLSLFLAYDMLGLLIYTSAYVALGYIFTGQLDQIITILGGAGERLTAALLLGLIAYVGFKVMTRYWLMHYAKSLAISAAEAHQKLTTTTGLLLVDLRGPMDFAADPFVIPGAKVWRESELMEAVEAMEPRTQMVLLCACPNQASSTRLALALRRKGFRQVRVLQDGLAGWRKESLPVEPWVPDGRAEAKMEGSQR